MVSGWRLAADSRTGTSHIRKGEPCQDAWFWSEVNTAAGPVLVAAVADGAGSARLSQVGSSVGCRVAVVAAAAALRECPSVDGVSDSTVSGWFALARRAVALEACVQNVAVRDMACTLSLAVIGPDSAVLAQIGDGAIVIPQGDGYHVPLWPATGEYLNTTYFLTDSDYGEHVRVARHAARVDELALITDGLELLALKLATHSVNTAFFRPLLASLRRTPCVCRYRQAMAGWLDSSQINARTDDDKTLVLACRV